MEEASQHKHDFLSEQDTREERKQIEMFYFPISRLHAPKNTHQKWAGKKNSRLLLKRQKREKRFTFSSNQRGGGEGECV